MRMRKRLTMWLSPMMVSSVDCSIVSCLTGASGKIERVVGVLSWSSELEF
jgi:hypothetical protein